MYAIRSYYVSFDRAAALLAPLAAEHDLDSAAHARLDSLLYRIRIIDRHDTSLFDVVLDQLLQQMGAVTRCAGAGVVGLFGDDNRALAVFIP